MLCQVACACPPDTKNTTSSNLLNQRLQRWEVRPELPVDAMSNLHLGQHEQVFNLLYEVDECVPIFEGFIAILCIINVMVKVSEEANAVFLKGPENGKTFIRR